MLFIFILILIFIYDFWLRLLIMFLELIVNRTPFVPSFQSRFTRASFDGITVVQSWKDWIQNFKKSILEAPLSAYRAASIALGFFYYGSLIDKGWIFNIMVILQGCLGFALLVYQKRIELIEDIGEREIKLEKFKKIVLLLDLSVIICCSIVLSNSYYTSLFTQPIYVTLVLVSFPWLQITEISLSCLHFTFCFLEHILQGKALIDRNKIMSLIPCKPL